MTKSGKSLVITGTVGGLFRIWQTSWDSIRHGTQANKSNALGTISLVAVRHTFALRFRVCSGQKTGDKIFGWLPCCRYGNHLLR